MGLGVSKPYAITPRIIFKSIKFDKSSNVSKGTMHSSRFVICSAVRGAGSSDFEVGLLLLYSSSLSDN